MIWLPAILILPYILILLKYYSKLREAEPFTESGNPSVSLSIIVPCYNEEKNLVNLLNCLARQDYAKHLFEVIIVDDNSTDRTFETASQFPGIQRISSIRNNGTGKKSAIRTGIAASESNLIVTTDADCHMGKSWIRIIASFFEQDQPDMIICPVKLETGKGFFRKFQEIEFLSLQGTTAGAALSREAIMCNGANLAFTREMYIKHSGDLHDEINSGDDIFLLQSLKKEKNPKIFWLESSEAIVTTKSSSAVGSFLRQRKRWISKGTSYTDKDIIITGIATFAVILLQISYLIGSLFNTAMAWTFLLIFLLKSIPDFLIIRNTVQRYRIAGMMRWFLPAQIVYPFYIMLVLFWKDKIRNPKFAPESYRGRIP